MRAVDWKELIEKCDTSKWKDQSLRNKVNKKKSTCKHTLGSQTYVTAKQKADEILECDTDFEFMWMQTHMKKGSRPLDKLKEISSSIDETEGENDANRPILEEIVESTNVNDWIDDRSHETYQNYKRLVMDKQKRGANRPFFNTKLWEQAGGRSQKGKTYVIGCISSSSLCGFQRADSEA